MATIDQLRLCSAKVKQANGPSAEIDQEMMSLLDKAEIERWNWRQPSASGEQALNLFKKLLPGRFIRVDPLDNDGFVCAVELYGKMPATPPCAVFRAPTEALAILGALIETLINLELDYWS